MGGRRRLLVLIAAGLLVGAAAGAVAAPLLTDRQDVADARPSAAERGRAKAGPPSSTPTTTGGRSAANLDDARRAEQKKESRDLRRPVPTPVDSPPLDGPITDPEAVASRYVVAVETVSAEEAGQRRRLPLLHPDNPEVRTGVLVVDAPPPGARRTAEVTDVAEWAETDDRIAYQVRYQPQLDDGGGPVAAGPEQTTYVVVARNESGGWLVLQHVPHLDPAD